MTIRGILFDKDGTLLDFNSTWVPVNRAAALTVAGGDSGIARYLLEECGQDEAAGRVMAGTLLAVGTTTEIAGRWAELYPDHGHADIVGLVDEVFQREEVEAAVPVSGLAATLTRLHEEGLILGVATSDSHAGALQSLSSFGVLELFDFVVGHDSGHGTKPGPGMVEAFCRQTGLSVDDICVVGDNTHDLEMGRNARVALVVGVLTGTGSTDDLAPDADHVIDSIATLDCLLDLR